MDLARVERSAEDRGRVVRSATPQRRRHPVQGCPDVAADDRHEAFLQQRAYGVVHSARGDVEQRTGTVVRIVCGQHRQRVDPVPVEPRGDERGRDQPAAQRLAERCDRVRGARRQLVENSDCMDERFEFAAVLVDDPDQVVTGVAGHGLRRQLDVSMA